jgi:hypothetical protein
MDTLVLVGALSALAKDLPPAGPLRDRGHGRGSIAEALQVPHSTLSSHLGLLARAMLVTARKEGRSVIYVGSQPTGQVHPLALNVLRQGHFDVSQLRSKSWEEFARGAAPKPMTAHWGLPDPVQAEGSKAERHLAFADTLRMLSNRIGIFVSLAPGQTKQAIAASQA